MKMLTQQEALAALRYVPDTGELTWLVQRGCVVPGQRAGAFDENGLAKHTEYRLAELRTVSQAAEERKS